MLGAGAHAAAARFACSVRHGAGLAGLGGIGGEEGGVEGNDVLSTSSTSGGEIRILQGWTTTFSTMTPLTGGS